jgi:hypothetical protein
MWSKKYVCFHVLYVSRYLIDVKVGCFYVVFVKIWIQNKNDEMLREYHNWLQICEIFTLNETYCIHFCYIMMKIISVFTMVWFDAYDSMRLGKQKISCLIQLSGILRFPIPNRKKDTWSVVHFFTFTRRIYKNCSIRHFWVLLFSSSCFRVLSSLFSYSFNLDFMFLIHHISDVEYLFYLTARNAVGVLFLIHLRANFTFEPWPNDIVLRFIFKYLKQIVTLMYNILAQNITRN